MKQVLILRGVSGSGKSTYAAKFPNAIICSADDFFRIDGEYKFDKTKQGQTHNSCYRKFIDSLLNEKELVIVDNMSIEREHITPYILGAGAFGYEWEIVNFLLEREEDLYYIVRRSRHISDIKVIEKQYVRLLTVNLTASWKQKSVMIKF